MADEAVTDQDVQQLTELQTKLTAPGVAAPDVCGIWRTIKPYWPIIIRVVRLIPKVGSIVASILEKLGRALDTFCGQ